MLVLDQEGQEPARTTAGARELPLVADFAAEFRPVPFLGHFYPRSRPDLYQLTQRTERCFMLSTAPSGSTIACELPNTGATLLETPQTSADFRPSGPVPKTLADLLPFADEDARKRYNATFKIISKWMGAAPDQIELEQLFLKETTSTFRPYLRENFAYLEYTTQHHRKGLTYLGKLAASLGVQVRPVFPEAWREVFKAAQRKRCVATAEYFALRKPSPADVTPEEVEAWSEDQIARGLRRKAGARKAKCLFLAVLRECGFTEQQPVESARHKDYAVKLDDLPALLKCDVEALLKWMLTGTTEEGRWKKSWRDGYDSSTLQKHYEGVREITANRVVSEICRLFGFLRNVLHDEEGIDSFKALLIPAIFCCYRDWLREVRKVGAGSMRTLFGQLFSSLRNFPGASGIDLSWTTDFIASLPEYSSVSRNARKLLRIIPFSALEAVPDQLRKERYTLIDRHKRAEAAEAKCKKREVPKYREMKIAKARAARLMRIAVLAQQELIMRWLVTLPWRNENLNQCRLHRDPVTGKPANLRHVPAGSVPGAIVDDWVRKLQMEAPMTLVWVFSFDEDETKAARPVTGVLPQSLGDALDEFLDYYRDILVCENRNLPTLFANQAGGSLNSQQLAEAVEEATRRYAGNSVNPHLARDIYALAYLLANDADYLTLSKILWHKNHLITVMTYSWLYDEAVGASAAGKWSEQRRLEKVSGAKQAQAAAGKPRVGCLNPLPFGVKPNWVPK